MSKILVTYCYYFYHETINKFKELDDYKWYVLSSESHGNILHSLRSFQFCACSYLWKRRWKEKGCLYIKQQDELTAKWDTSFWSVWCAKCAEYRLPAETHRIKQRTDAAVTFYCFQSNTKLICFFYLVTKYYVLDLFFFF